MKKPCKYNCNGYRKRKNGPWCKECYWFTHNVYDPCLAPMQESIVKDKEYLKENDTK